MLWGLKRYGAAILFVWTFLDFIVLPRLDVGILALCVDMGLAWVLAGTAMYYTAITRSSWAYSSRIG